MAGPSSYPTPEPDRPTGTSPVFFQTPVVELYEAIQQACGVRREARLAPARLGELQRSVLDPALAARELGWRPEHSLAEGLAETWSWITG